MSDFYFHSLRLVPANLLWGLTAIVLVFVGLASPVIAILATPLLAIAGMLVFRVAAGVVRHEPGISIREAIADCGACGWPPSRWASGPWWWAVSW